MKKFARFNMSGDVFWALVEGNNVFRVIDSIYSRTPEINQKPINYNCKNSYINPSFVVSNSETLAGKFLSLIK